MPLASDLGQTERLTTIVHPRSGALMIKYEQPLHNTVLISIIYVQVFFPIRHAKKKMQTVIRILVQWFSIFLTTPKSKRFQVAFQTTFILQLSICPCVDIHSSIIDFVYRLISMFLLLAIWNIISWAINLTITDTIGCVYVCVCVTKHFPSQFSFSYC